MRIGHRATRRLQPGDDLVESLFAREAHELQAEGRDMAFDAGELQMHRRFVAEGGNGAGDLVEIVRAVEQALQVGDRAVGLQRPQRGVVPGELIERRNVIGVAAGRALEHDPAAAVVGQHGERLARRIGDQAERDGLAGRKMGQQRLEILRGTPVEDGDQLLGDAVGLAQRVAEGSGAADIVEGHDRLVPRPGARQREFQLGDDAVGAIGVDGLHDLLAAQLQYARLFLHGDHAQSQDIAAAAQAAELDRAHAARAAGDEAADRRRAPRRGMEAELPALRQAVGFEIAELEAGLHARDPVLQRQEPIEAAEIEHDAALERHCLAVIAGAGTARRHRDAAGVAIGEGAHDLVLVGRADHEIAAHTLQPLVQHRRIPEEIAALLAHQRAVGDAFDRRQIGRNALPVDGLHAAVHRLIFPGLSRPCGSASRLKASCRSADSTRAPLSSRM